MEQVKLVKANFSVGDVCVCEHHWAFRSGEPFKIIGITLIYIKEIDELRYSYIFQFSDGVLDSIPVISEKEYKMKSVMARI